MVEKILRREELLGTQFEIGLLSMHQDLFLECFSRVREIESKFSRFLASSLLSKCNEKLRKWQEIDAEFFDILYQAKRLFDFTDGHFNIALHNELIRIGYDAHYSFRAKPSFVLFTRFRFLYKRLLRKYVPSYDLRKTIIDVSQFEFTLRFSHEGDLLVRIPAQSILRYEVFLRDSVEIGGFGKGYALDVLRELLTKKGVIDYYVNAGGDICAKGLFDTILLENPFDTSLVLGSVLLSGKSIAASSHNRRAWGKKNLTQGQVFSEYTHLLNAKNGKRKHSLAGVFVVHEIGLDADALATALYSMGFLAAITFAKKHNLSVLLLSTNREYFVHNLMINWF
jgi:thiamine biosynthesis lipoprotein ApbE